MIKNDKIISQLAHGDIVETISRVRKVGISEARKLLQDMSFSEYVAITEANQVIPPSGNAVGSETSTNTAQPEVDKSKMWANKNAPITPGMSVGIADDAGGLVPMQVSQVDSNASGVKVKDPTTGKEQWYNKDELATLGEVSEETEEEDEDNAGLQRMLELAGIYEMTSAGCIAAAPTPLGGVRKRSEESVTLDKEHQREKPYQSIVGDTKPSQSSGELSANLAASGKPTANRRRLR